MIIYRSTDRIPVRLGDVVLYIAPLTHGQKIALNSATTIRSGKEIIDGIKMAFLAIKYAVKGQEGIVDSLGNKYELQFTANGELEDACVDDLMGLDHAEDLAVICVKLIDGIGAARDIAKAKGLAAQIDLPEPKVSKKKLGAVS